MDVDLAMMLLYLPASETGLLCCSHKNKSGFCFAFGFVVERERLRERERNRLSAVFLRRILPVKISSTSPARHSFRTIGGGSSTLSSARFTTDPDRIGYTPIPTIKS